MKPITNIALSIEIDSGNAAFVESLEAAEAELCRLLDEAKKKISDNLDPDAAYNMLEQTLHDINGNACGTVCITTDVDEDVIDDEDEWRDSLRDYISENGFHMEDISTTFYDLDAAYEHDSISVEQWFANHTSARIDAGEVVPEASNWSYA